jgi:hypothetical protein
MACNPGRKKQFTKSVAGPLPDFVGLVVRAGNQGFDFRAAKVQKSRSPKAIVQHSAEMFQFREVDARFPVILSPLSHWHGD